jgi:plasmid stabilization system protein ParE
VAEVRLTPDAEAEYEEALAWYLARSVRAAARFETAFEAAVASIESNPNLYALIDDEHRACLLRRYPYSLVYRVQGDQVQVIAVAHASRDPGYWSGRSSNP